MIRSYEKGKTETVSSFKSSDFDCQCKDPSCIQTLIDHELIEGLGEMVKQVPDIKILSGFRCQTHNKRVGGSPNSQHVLGRAVDITSEVVNYRRLKEIAEGIRLFNEGGIGLYPQSKFLHVDVRGVKTRWTHG